MSMISAFNTLNSLDPNKLKSLDSLIPENARRQRTQLPVGSDLTYFDFDRDGSNFKRYDRVGEGRIQTIFPPRDRC